ncbi:MAG: hypothetical protein LBC35_01900 [Coriobacteriales bacterium]|nr:hypothetical protein [Coriobacteriales bacterium]
MRKEILIYRAELDKELARLVADNDAPRSTRASTHAKDSEALLENFERRLADFQHERLIHLIITLFFAGATLALFFSIVAITPVFLAVDSPLSPHTGIGLIALLLIFIIVDIFYIRHYYFLENSVQALYGYRKKIVALPMIIPDEQAGQLTD